MFFLWGFKAQVEIEAGKVEKAHRNELVKKSKCNNTRDSSWKNDNGNSSASKRMNCALQQNADLLTMEHIFL